MTSLTRKNRKLEIRKDRISDVFRKNSTTKLAEVDPKYRDWGS